MERPGKALEGRETGEDTELTIGNAKISEPKETRGQGMWPQMPPHLSFPQGLRGARPIKAARLADFWPIVKLPQIARGRRRVSPACIPRGRGRLVLVMRLNRKDEDPRAVDLSGGTSQCRW